MDLISGKRVLELRRRLLILVCLVVVAQKCKSQEQKRCISKGTCAGCIEEDPTCAWCSQEDSVHREIPRCNTVENLRRERCTNIVNPQNSVRNIRDQPLSHKGAIADRAVQIKPQEIKINLRPSSTGKFSITYRQAVHYPVDLYLLMDLSYTMKDDKINLARLGQTLGREMQRITTDFRLGFGSFVDKVIAPYSDTNPQRIENPCREFDVCARSYSFKNHMSLSSDITEFVTRVNDAEVSANVDSPEGTLDAVMQAIVCQNEIGWRHRSRKLIVIATDEDFHYAGDGKLGGVIKPNDCNCHLDANGYYTMSAQQDYPSMSQMKRKIKEHNVNLIFAVPSNKVRLYEILRNRLTATTVGRLEKDSTNIVTLIKKQYDKISSTITMTEKVQGPDIVAISYYSKCLDGTMKMRNVCGGVRPGDSVTFDVFMKFSACPQNKNDWNQKIELHPVGLSDSVTVDLDMICECDCKEDKGKEEENRQTRCSGKGTYQCGVCKCDDTAHGAECQCDVNGNQMHFNSTGCKHGNNQPECSGRGECRCGQCICDKRENPEEKYDGRYCECSNFECFEKNKKICNGHGTCDCGTCKCNKGWKGPDCGCNALTDGCVFKSGEEVCSGHGTCNCGSCDCYESYYGKFCEDCEQCLGKCEKYGVCASCVLSSTEKDIYPELCENCEDLNVEIVDKIEVNETQKIKICHMEDENGCNIIFKYSMNYYDNDIIQVQSTRDCPKPADLVTIASSTAGSVLFAGIVALLLWKFLTELHDRREFAKFQKDLDQAKWDAGDNPIFIQPSSTFENPAFGYD